MGQQWDSMGYQVDAGQHGWGPILPVGEDSGLGSDPFNLMPIIEHHQKTRKMRKSRGRGEVVFSSSSSQSLARVQKVVPLPALGQRLTREDETLVSQREGRKKVLDPSNSQPRRQQ